MSRSPPGNVQSWVWSGSTQAGGVCPQPVLGPARARPAPSAEAPGPQRGLLGGFCFSGGLGVDSTRACSSMITGRLCGLRLLTGHVPSWALGQAGSRARGAQHSPCNRTFAFPRTAESQAPAGFPVGAKAPST